MEEHQPSTLSKKKEAIIMSEEFLLGYAAMVPPIFIAGLLYKVPLEKFQTQEKTVIITLLFIVGIINAGIERYKRENKSLAKKYDYPNLIKIADVFFPATQGFGSVAISFLALAIYEELQSTVQKFHLPILIIALIYTAMTCIKTIVEKRAIPQSDNPEEQVLLRKNNAAEKEGFFHDINFLMDYMNNAFFAAAFQVAPIEFVVDAFNKLTLPAFISLFATTLLFTFARGAVYNYKRNHPEVTAKEFPSWVKAIELVCKTNDSFSLFVIPILVLNSFVPLNVVIKMIGVAMAAIYSIISTINKANDLGLIDSNPRVDNENEDASYWQSVKNTAISCCGFFPTGKSDRSYAREMLDSPLESNNLLPPRNVDSLHDQRANDSETNGCWDSMKKATTSCLAFFSSSKNSRIDSNAPSLLRSDYVQLN